MKIRANLISGQIKQFQKLTGITDATFGRYAMNNSNFVRRAREVGDHSMVTMATAHKCGAYMIRVLEASKVPEAVKFRETLQAWLAHNPVPAEKVKANPKDCDASPVISPVIPAAIADTLKPAEAFILQKFIDAVVKGETCPTRAELATAYEGGKSLAWPGPHIARLTTLGLIKIDGGNTTQRRITLLFAPFQGMSTKYIGKVKRTLEPVVIVQRVDRSEPCVGCGEARTCSCARPTLIHTRTGGHLPNLLRSEAR